MKQTLKKIIPPVAIDCARHILSVAGVMAENIPKEARLFSDPEKQIFFGYYDISPICEEDRYLLANAAPKENISPHDKNPELELGYYDLHQENPEFVPFAKTVTWNWQQAARLQWITQEDSKKKCVIYNTLEDGAYAAVIQDVLSGEVVRRFALPVYAVSRDGRFALSLDFDRLHDCRPGYGYNHFPKGEREDVIRSIDLSSGEGKIIMTMDALKEFAPHPSMQGANHYFNHLSISPAGTRYMVTHLWVSPEGKRYSRLIVSDPKRKDVFICPNNSGHTSHYAWKGDDAVLIFCTVKGEGQRYRLYDIDTRQYTLIAQGKIKEDGHPTWVGQSKMLTDTYPNLLRLQNLLLYDTSGDDLLKLASFHVPRSFTGEVRCDLHPRINNSGTMACVDIVRNNRRALCVLNISDKGE